MSYKVKTIDVFERQAKRLIKKYTSLKNELIALVHDLKQNPKLGTPHRAGMLQNTHCYLF